MLSKLFFIHKFYNLPFAKLKLFEITTSEALLGIYVKIIAI